MITIKKIFFDNKFDMQKCFQIRQDVFVKEQKCDPKKKSDQKKIGIVFSHPSGGPGTLKKKKTVILINIPRGSPGIPGIPGGPPGVKKQ